jgi:hypothetical protein
MLLESELIIMVRAAKTALLLDNTQLGSSAVTVTPAQSFDQMVPGKTSADPDSKAATDIEQEDKPRSRIVAEYLAHGYVIGDVAIQKAIELDTKHGISNRFTSALANFDNKYHATDRARSMDQSYGVMDKASQGWRGLNSYFEKAIGTPTGRKVVAFYTRTAETAQEVHTEARRLADLKKKEYSGSSSTALVPVSDASEKAAGKFDSIREKSACQVAPCEEKLADAAVSGCTCATGPLAYQASTERTDTCSG